jgi:hypothetical protein
VTDALAAQHPWMEFLTGFERSADRGLKGGLLVGFSALRAGSLLLSRLSSLSGFLLSESTLQLVGHHASD